MKTATIGCLMFLLTTPLACKSKDEGNSGAESAGSKASAEQATDEADTAGDRTQEEEQPASATVAGYVSFELNGEPKKFEYLPGENNMVSSVTTIVHAAAEADSGEFFSVILTHFDARTAEYPTELELSVTFDPKKHKSPADVAKAPKPMVVYVAPNGTRYGGYNKVALESFDGGVLRGTAEDIELTSRKGGDGPVKLSAIEFEAQLGAPIPGAIDNAMGKSLE